MSFLREELRRLLRLSLPVMGAQVASMTMGTVDTIMVGRFSVEALAAAAIANAWIYGVLLAGQGLVHGIDPLVTQAHGAGRGDEAARALQRGIFLGALASLPLAGLWLFTGDLLRALGQSSELADLAHGYTVAQIPSLPCFLVFIALRQYLHGREIVRPTLWVTLVANVFNALANWALIFGGLGLPALGLLGAGIATAFSRAFMLLGLFAWVRGMRLHAGAWVPWSRSVVASAPLGRIVSLGLPVAMQMALEVWAFSGATLLAGLIGEVPLAAHTIVLNMAALTFMMPLGLSQAAVTRVGNLLGAGDGAAARRASGVALALGATVMSVAALAFVLLRGWLPRVYTRDAAVVALAATILPIAAAFQIFDGLQVVASGILRGMGQTRPAAFFNLVAYWIVGLPLGAWLALRAGWALPGLWWGLCLGLATVATSLLLWIRHTGPSYWHTSARSAAPAPAPAKSPTR